LCFSSPSRVATSEHAQEADRGVDQHPPGVAGRARHLGRKQLIDSGLTSGSCRRSWLRRCPDRDRRYRLVPLRDGLSDGTIDGVVELEPLRGSRTHRVDRIGASRAAGEHGANRPTGARKTPGARGASIRPVIVGRGIIATTAARPFAIALRMLQHMLVGGDKTPAIRTQRKV
jgi:hypothetical protein